MPNGRSLTSSVAEKAVSRRNALVLRLAVVVRQVLEPRDQPEAAPVDLVRARVVANVVRLPRPVGEKRHTPFARSEVVAEPRARWTGNHVPGADRVILTLAAVFDLSRRRPELERALSFEDDEDFLVCGVAVRRCAGVAVLQVAPVEARADCAGLDRHACPAPRVAVVLRVDLARVDDVRGPGRRLREAWLARCGLTVPRTQPTRHLEDEAGVVAHHVSAREVCDVRADSLAEGEHVQPVVARTEGVLLTHAMHDAVAGADLVRLALLYDEPGPVQHEDNLFGVQLAQKRRRPATRFDLDAIDVDLLATGGITECRPRRAHVT